MMNRFEKLHFAVRSGAIQGGRTEIRRLSDLRGYFSDTDAFEKALTEEDRLLYTVSSVSDFDGSGDLHFGLGTLFPGRIGDEYHMTKGHLHTRREAAELYIGVSGRGLMLLEDEASGESTVQPLERDALVYVPGHTAHRTINTGTEPLVYLGVYPADAGHDYAFVAERNFRKVVVARDGRPLVLDRAAHQRGETASEPHDRS